MSIPERLQNFLINALPKRMVDNMAVGRLAQKGKPIIAVMARKCGP